MTETEKGQRRKKIPPTPGFEPQVTQCLVRACKEIYGPGA